MIALDNNRKDIINKVINIGFLAVISFLFVLFYSTSTSPLYPDYYGDDAAQFRTIGMVWAKGLVPYINAFDHKGPFIFFVNMLGYLSSYVLVQSIFLLGGLWGIYSIARLYSCKWYYQWLTVLVSVFYLFYIYEGGDMTEEYCLPFLAWSMYLIIKYFKTDEKHAEHPWKYAVIYGVCFGICFLTRVTNFIMVAAGILVILIVLLLGKSYNNVLKNILGFLTGAGIVIAPFAIYFAINGAFEDFLDGTILANLRYMNANEAWISLDNTSETIRNWILAYLCVTLMIVPIILIRRNTKLRFFCLLAMVMELYLYLGGNFYFHYPIVCLPQLALIIGEFWTYKGKNKWIPLVGLMVVFLLYCRINLVSFFRWPYDRYLEFNQGDKMPYDLMMDVVDADSFVAYGDFASKSVYLRYEIIPYYRYFAIQDWHARSSREMSDEIYDTFEKGKVRYILVEENKCMLIRDILENQYELIESLGGFGMYRLID